MSRRAPSGVLSAAAALVVSGAGCAGVRWAPLASPSDRLLAVPTGAKVVGLGAKVSTRGLIPKRCLAKAESSTATGEYTVELRAAGPSFRSGDEATDAFVEACARQADRARPSPSGPPPVAALLVVASSGQWTTLEEGSATFSEEARRALAAGRDWEFFERCGTHYVQAVRREPSALIYVALYPADAAERERWAAQLDERAGRAPDDLFALAVLDRLVGTRRAFLAIRADADQAFEVLPVGRGPGRGAGALAGSALRASFGADRGRIVELGLRPWSQLPEAALLLREREEVDEEPARRERLFQRLKLLEGRALDRETLLAQLAGRGGTGECRAALARSLAPFSWAAYGRCRDATHDALPATLDELEACRPVLAAVGGDDLPEPCAHLAADDGRPGDPRRRIDTRYPLVLQLDSGQAATPGGVGAQTDRWGNAFSTSCLRRSRAAAPEPAPLPKPWSQDDWDPLSAPGAAAPPAPPERPPEPAPPPPEAPGPVCIDAPGGGRPLCLHQKGEAPQGEAPGPPAPKTAGPAPAPQVRRAEILGVSAGERFEGERRWPWWKKLLYPLLFSWKAPESPRPIYRGDYELRTLEEDVGGGEPELTEEAAALARSDLAAFYRRCGTHRVRQVVGRQGVAYHFAPGGPGDREISVLPYGVSRQTAERPELHPARAQDFLDGQARWLEPLSAASPALPEQLVLEPWSELLLETGAIQPHQLSPLSPDSGG